MIKYFTMIFSFAYLAATKPLCTYRVSTFKPVNRIYIMNVLFGNMIAAKPVEIIPVTHLVFHFCLVVFAWTNPYAVIVPPGLCRGDFTNQVLAFEQLPVRVLI